MTDYAALRPQSGQTAPWPEQSVPQSGQALWRAAPPVAGGPAVPHGSAAASLQAKLASMPCMYRPWSATASLRAPCRICLTAAALSGHRSARNISAWRLQHVPAGDGCGVVRAHIELSPDLLDAIPRLAGRESPLATGSDFKLPSAAFCG